MTKRERRMLRAHQALQEAIDLRDPIAISWAAAEVHLAHARAHHDQQQPREAVR